MKVEDANVTESPAPETDDSKTEAPVGEDKPAEDIKEAEPESAGKPKKEKVKKKWSFRSLSFGKKDKQKPSKKDKKNEENKAVAESCDEKVVVGEVDSKPAEVVDEKPQVEYHPLETVAEAVAADIKEEEEVKAAKVSAPAPEPVVEPLRAKTPEPVVVVEAKIEAPVVVKEVETEIPVAQPEVASEPVLEPPAIPTTPPPSQFSVFAETMNTNTAEENLPEPVVEAVVTRDGIEMEIVVEQVQEMDIEPVVDMIEKVLELAVDRIEAETAEKVEEDLPPPPAEELVETPPVAETVEVVTQNGVGEHTEEVEIVKVTCVEQFIFMSNRSS